MTYPSLPFALGLSAPASSNLKVLRTRTDTCLPLEKRTHVDADGRPDVRSVGKLERKLTMLWASRIDGGQAISTDPFRKIHNPRLIQKEQ
jgi:hypothetical protein